ncbi:MarR family winged helix-turn-helix transcriptional regulator [Porphyromonas crevioricanis]|uniref:Transcriptional repressor MprA n=2 Tax=Porphyromonas crevioricanis TaxID=393921 RepID=A0A2X4PIH5_9PORP|nr:MarR family winged helix-turn-helix transcriptional regulator [Porphyromonas crevioricanis]GAD05221.1 transcriptional regulator, MarR family [Porphyromonas crevioricanis JCM 15906]GAD06445.1 transcriptional regulator, MarR family [Porphyromonas crevioricanis JCM 13913]SJZ99424.1 DNA-binding transcriptional regulator, MarR family [Porphyromonas crevioricanis]SQH72470.1 transcriptional repressor MprA [Porphyromonas crevioricanis]
MNKTELLKYLIDEIEEYADVMGLGDCLTPSSFAAFLSVRTRSIAGDKAPEQPDRLDINIARDFALIYRYSRSYVKRAMQDSKLQTLEEYTYLATLLTGGVMTKTELNNANAMEKTSGAEVIQRLIKKGLVSQQASRTDRRSMDVSITEEGRQEIFKIFAPLKKSAALLTSSLKEGQKVLLSRIQTVLCADNHQLFLEHRETPLEELAELKGVTVDNTTTSHGRASRGVSAGNK